MGWSVRGALAVAPKLRSVEVRLMGMWVRGDFGGGAGVVGGTKRFLNKCMIDKEKYDDK